MLLLWMLAIGQIRAAPQPPLNMYSTNDGQQDRYCLSYYSYTTDYNHENKFSKTIHTEQMMFYCLRSAKQNSSLVDFNTQNYIHSNFTFAQLAQQNITSQMLLLWSATIDLAEQYQIFLNNHSNSSTEKDTIFYNCTSSWFGPYCQFIFDYQMNPSFSNLVRSIFSSKKKIEDQENIYITCYEHLTFETLLTCLDWREICDGKADCRDGSDEIDCWQLEVNQCTKDEYRCYNGQCIPIEFFNDIDKKPDCLDRTDERLITVATCHQNPDFACEEHRCPPGIHAFSCGDGSCTDGLFTCEIVYTNLLSNNDCFKATACDRDFPSHVYSSWCQQFCWMSDCLKAFCPMRYEFTNLPRLFGHVRFVVLKDRKDSNKKIISPNYICYNATLCPHFPPSQIFFDNLICQPWNDWRLPSMELNINRTRNLMIINNRFRGCLVTINKIDYCNYSGIYRCINSTKCISQQRLLDGFSDCPFNDDETFNESCSLSDIHQRFKCKDGKCYSPIVIRNLLQECTDGEDEATGIDRFRSTQLLFEYICDGEQHLTPVFIDNQYETDESGCNHWQCDNIYSRCDRFWLCENGADESDCPLSTCPKHYHECVLPNDTSKISCLPQDKAGDSEDHCLGGIDEQKKYYSNVSKYNVQYRFHCWNATPIIELDKLCDKINDCRFYDDEIFCKTNRVLSGIICAMIAKNLSNIEKYFCRFTDSIARSLLISFKLENVLAYPLQLFIANSSLESAVLPKLHFNEINLENKISNDVLWRCNRGVSIQHRRHKNISTLSCLCPPSFYGDICQYQNQRVSLTVQIQAVSDWRRIFIFLFTLIDNERRIQSYDHIEYIPVRDCQTKFNIYLLYSNRPKNASKTFSVQIDTFNHLTLEYRNSWIFPIQFSFLPVYRLAILLKVPFSKMTTTQNGCARLCLHGQCFHYTNDYNSTYCRCEPGWSGAQCDIQHVCDCAPDAVCISNSICLCPPGRFGTRCYLSQSICQSKTCLNGGQCVSIDARYVIATVSKSNCICPEGFLGDDWCENQKRQTQIDITFHQKIMIPSVVFIHFIAVQEKNDPNRITIIKKIAFDQYSVRVYTYTPFNIALAQLNKEYYLIVIRKEAITFGYISTTIIPSQRCRSIHELFVQSLANQHLLKRVKYYHVPCQQRLDLVCFYDEIHVCLCTADRRANCFRFNHNITYDCKGYNHCENNAHCFYDHPTCPTASLCACDVCSFGSKCQLSTKGSTLFLDTILGYHIRSKTPIHQQPSIIKLSIALSVFIFVAGFINSFLTFQTFRGKESQSVGCCLYLYASSIVSLMMVVMLALKFSFFLSSQIGSITNRSFLRVHCISMDFFVRALLTIDDWLSACVAVERVANVMQGVRFNKAKSKRIAKWMILTVVIVVSCSNIYDPIHRRLIDDEEEQRTWCVAQYSFSIQILDWTLNIFHFLVPFVINCVSAVIIILITARTRSNVQKKKLFKDHLKEQLREHKHLLISPLVIIFLSVPRVAISFLSGCMKSSRDSWYYLVGYFISFIPSIMTLVVFVLPSDVFKRQFCNRLKQICQR